MQVRLQKIRDREAQATTGPWIYLFGDEIIYTKLEDGCRGLPVAKAVFGLGTARFNAEFIAHARQDVPYLLDALQQVQRKYLDGLEEWTNNCLMCDKLELASLEIDNKGLKQQLIVLQDALKFYANKDNHEQYYIGNGEPVILEDAGKIARVALGQEVAKC